MTTTDQSRVYFISPWRRALLWWIIGPFLLLGAWLAIGGDDAEQTAGVVVMVLMGVMLAGWQWLVSRTRLVLTTEGVRLYQLGMRMEAHWRDIESLRLGRGREGFVTSVSLTGKGADRLAALRGISMRGAAMYGPEQQAYMAERRWIPIEAFGWYLRRGALGADIARFAPHVVSIAPPVPTAAEARKDSRAILLVVALVVLGLAIPVALALAPDDAQGRIERVVDGALAVFCAVAAPLLTWRTAWSSRHAFRERSVLVGILFGFLTVVLACWCLLAWQTLAELWQ